jgi:hypothetical protein
MNEKLRYPLLAASVVTAVMTFSQVGSAQAPAPATAPASEKTTDQPSPPPQIIFVPAAPGAGAAPGAAAAPGVAASAGVVASAGVPSSTCRPGYTQQGFRLCMSGARPAVQYDNAALYCQDEGARVADLIDWRYRIFRGDGLSAPVGFWFGPRTGDDRALFANSSNPGNPDGEASVFDSRGYACAHDLIR